MDDILKRADEARRKAQEDAVHYEVFAADALAGPVTDAALETVAIACMSSVIDMLRGYIWHKDDFRLAVSRMHGHSMSSAPGVRSSVGVDANGTNDDAIPRLAGVTRFGDNIEDEWFVVHLLLAITRANTSLVARVWDADGEFLLIEGADHLPGWLDPEASENRVFLAGGHVHLLPLPSAPGDIAILPVGRPSLQQAVLAVACHPHKTRASSPIENAVLARIGTDARRHAMQHHYSNCRLPRATAALLRASPESIAPAAEAFYLRDPITFRACQSLRRVMPPGTDFVTCRVRFTRAIYAMLKCQRFNFPPSFGRPPPRSSPEYAAWEMGAKIACGFEMLLVEAERARISRSVVESEDANNLERAKAHPLWKNYAESLRGRGYFRDEMEGSRLHRELMSAAADDFIASYVDSVRVQVGNATAPQSPGDIGRRTTKDVWAAPGEIVLRFYESICASVKGDVVAGDTLPSPSQQKQQQQQQQQQEQQQDDVLSDDTTQLLPSDSDAWMEMTVDDLEAMASERSGIMRDAEKQHAEHKSKSRSDGTTAADDEFDLTNVADKLRSFLGKVSSHEGVVFPGQPTSAAEGLDSDDEYVDATTTHTTSKPPHSESNKNSMNSSNNSNSTGEKSARGTGRHDHAVRKSASDTSLSSVGFDSRAFVKTMRTVLGMDADSDSDSDADSESQGRVSDMDDLFGEGALLGRGFSDLDSDGDDSSDGESDAFVASGEGDDGRQARQLEQGMKRIAHLSRAMDAELAANSTLGASFARMEDDHGDDDDREPLERPLEAKGASNGAGAGTAGHRAPATATEGDAPSSRGDLGDRSDRSDRGAAMRGIDIDVNLVKNILDSFAAQHGMAGPVSNLLGSMGIRVPDDAASPGSQNAGKR